MTRLLLKTALIELMQEKPFSQITVKELCQQADLNRTTFYLHYGDQQSVLRDIEQEVLAQTAEHMKNISPTTDAVELIEAFLKYVQKNAMIFRTLLVGGADEDFQVSMIRETLQAIRDRLPSYGDPGRERYVLTFLMHGSVSIIKTWLTSDFDLSARDAAQVIYGLCDCVQHAELYPA